uniref:Helicase ARIP4 n=1 Tax=Biomphalaria glabrata TaxID=6526 RepID=A0A2C9JT34_BIOGL
MEEVANLVDSGGDTDTLSRDIISGSLESYLSEQKEKPAELKMIDSDILALANQVGDELEDSSVDGAALATDLSFLAEAEAKETAGEVDDAALSFLVGDGKMEVANEDLAFLEEQDMSEGESYSEEEGESEVEEESGDETELNTDEDATEEEKSGEEEKKTDAEEDGVFGQVSFYDEESSNSVDVQKQKKKKVEKKVKTKKVAKGKKRKAEGNDDMEKKGKKKKLKRKKKKVKAEEDEDDDEDDKLPKSGATLMRRKNIRSILKEKDLDKSMLSAQNEELERQKRLMELKKSLLRENASAGTSTTAKVAPPAVSTASTSTGTSTKTASASTGTSTPKEKDSQLKSLLQVAEEEAEKEAENKERKLLDKDVVKVKKESRETSPPSDVITLSSDTDDSDDYDDDDDSDEVVMVPSDEGEDDEDDGAEDVNNGGAHIDDTLNLPDPDGRVKVNIGHPAEDPDIYLAPQIAQAIKPHQIGGVRFLYDNVVESLERYRTTPGFGCILAHSMGLGKTIQLISFIDIFLRYTGGKLVLCIVPINTLQNWLAEFNYWLPPKEKLHPDDNLTQSRSFTIYIINDSMKTTAARAAVIGKWKENGGVLLMGYEMFRLLSSKKVAPSKAKSRSKKTAPEVIDVEEEDKNKSLMIDMHGVLVDPGPDLVVCDEGHRIKNSSAAISQALKNIKSRRRVVLTGYPLQNNLMEYWCMVDFVRPNFLGTKTEFSNMFERPIMNGQCMDSTSSDKKIMRHRSYVLHNLLEGFVQRRGHTVLQVNLPPKTEHVFLVRLSPIQRKIYCEFMNAISESGLCSWANNNPLKAFAVCCKIWNHPDILHEVLTQHIADKDNDLDIDTAEGGTSKKKKTLTPSASSASLASTDSTATLTPSASTTSLASMASETTNEKNPITYDWAEPLMKDYIAGLLENSGKFILMMSLVEECLCYGDKVLIFSQSLLTLNKIEEFMGKFKVPRMELNENWQRNRTYFRLDGSTSAQDREKLINQFNDPESNIWVFLLSTKAGCLGINLVAANRVIVVDASWNPCHDCQAICRVYRFGQIKNSYVYRLITDNTLEKRIYDRQINKQGMSDRIVDDMNPENKLTRRQVENLLDFEDQEFPPVDFSSADNKYGHDPVMINVLMKHGQWLTKQPFTHESLLIDRKELRLSKREKRIAKEGYARDKRMNVTYTRPTYAAYYPQQGILPNRLPLNSRYNYAAFRRGPIVRPIASVRPMIAANVQNGAEKIKQFGGQPLRPGVTIHQVITTTEIVLPGTATNTQAGASAVNNKIGAGEKILVIKTPKGVYIRTNDGKMFAVRSKSGVGIGDIGGTSASTTTTATTTFTSAGGNQVFITPSINMGPGGKKPPIIIVSNKKGMPITMTRGGSIIRTLPYGSTQLLNSLKPSILRTDGTLGTAASTSTGEKVTSLADLIASEDDDSKDGTVKKMSDGSTQAEGAVPKRPVIVLPSLAVRTPRPPSSIQSSTIATTSPGGGTVVIMPTKPVVSMGTKRAPKNPRPRKPAKGKNIETDNSVGVGTSEVSIGTGKKKGVSLLANMNVAITTSTSTPAASGSITSTSTSSTKTQGSNTNNSEMQRQTAGANASVAATNTQTGSDIAPSNQHQNQQQQSAFPDLNSMWHSNFGSGPSMGSQNMPSGPNNTMLGAANNAPSNMSGLPGSIPSGPNTMSGGPNMHGGPGLMSGGPSAMAGGPGTMHGGPGGPNMMSGGPPNSMSGGSHPMSVGQVPMSSGPQHSMSSGPPHSMSSGPQHPMSSGPQHLMSSGPQQTMSSGPQHQMPIGQHSMSSGPQQSMSGPQHSVSSGPQHSMSSGPQHSVSSGPPHSVSSGPQHSLSSGQQNSITSGPQHSMSSGPQHSISSGPHHSMSSGSQQPMSSGPLSLPGGPGHTMSSNNHPMQATSSSSSTNNVNSSMPGASNSYNSGMMMSTAGSISDGDNSSNSSNQNLMNSRSQPQNQSGGFSSQHTTSYNNMSNPYMHGGMGSYGMVPSSMMSQSMSPPLQNHMPQYMSSMHSGFMSSPPGPFSQSLPPPPQSDPMQNPSHQGNNSMMYGSAGNSQFAPSFSHSQQNPPPFGSTSNNSNYQGSTNPNFGFNSDIGGLSYGAPTTSASYMSQPQSDQSYAPPSQANMASGFHQSSGSQYAMDTSNDNFTNQNPPQQLPMASSSSSTTPNYSDPGMSRSNRDESPFSLTLLGSDSTSTSASNKSGSKSNQKTKTSSSKKSKNTASTQRVASPTATKPQPANTKQRGGNAKVPSPAPSPRHTPQTPESNKSFTDLSNSRPSNIHSMGSNTNSLAASGQEMDSLSSSLAFPSFDGGSSLTSGFSNYGGPSMSSSLSSGLLSHSLGSDIGMGGSAFRAHQSPANPQPFRLDGSGGIGSMVNTGLNYNSSMSAFSSPGGLSGPGGYGNPSFGGFGSGYGTSSSLPFSSSPIMPPPPQSMMGYPQPLGYPSMSSLMMGAPSSTPSTMGGSMWPMMPSSMMGTGYGYPPHPSSMGFSSGIDGQGFGHLGPGPNS